MDATTSPTLNSAQRHAVEGLAAQMKQTFGPRLHALVAYGDTAPDQFLHTLALVDRVAFEDLSSIAPSMDRWRRAGLAVPLLLSRQEFARSLDVFPVEYGEIVARHVTIVGHAPFADAQIAEADRRRSCELQAKSHLIHLREGFLEAGGDLKEVVYLIASSIPAFRSLLANIARLDGDPGAAAGDHELAAFSERSVGLRGDLVRDVLTFKPAAGAIADPTALLARYIAATERVWAYVDEWKRR